MGAGHVFDPAPFPIKCLEKQVWDEEPIFDPLVHLEVGRPDCHCYTLKEEEGVSGTDFKFTDPFQVLSPEGLKVALEMVARNMSYARPRRQHEAIVVWATDRASSRT